MVCSASMATKVTLQSGKTWFYPIKYYCAGSIIEELEKFLLRKISLPITSYGETEKWEETFMMETCEGNFKL